KDGITATDAVVIAGLSPFKTRYELWAQKSGLVDEQPAGEAAMRGILLEQAVADWYTLETGRKLKRSNGIVRRIDTPWAMASLDRTVVGEPGLVEVKTSTSQRWQLYPVPPEYVAQVQWQMFCTGAPWVDVVALLGGLKFRLERVMADGDYQQDLYRKAVEFRELIASGTPPAVIGTDSDTLAKVVPQSSDEWAKADDGVERVAAQYSDALYESKLADEHLQNLAIVLKEAIGEKVGVIGNGWQATWKQNATATKTDWEQVAKVLQSVAPDTYAEAVKRHTAEKVGARVFRFKDGGVK
ncbi:MAG: YqaJ viral recombinase family protein, partial [Hylemonella sp.]